MFYENSFVNVNIQDVIGLKQKKVNLHNTGRNFSALSFRLRSDGLLKSEAGEYRVRDNCVAFVPARTDYTRIAAVDELIVIHFDVINAHFKEIEVFSPENAQALKEHFQDIFYHWNKKEVGYKYKCTEILYKILSVCHQENYKPQRAVSKIQGSVDYMLAHYKEPHLSMEEIARRSFISEVYFRKLFKAQFQTSPQRYIVFLRMQHAAQMISSGYYSLKEVALLSGYPDYKYFSTEFKKHFGVSPSHYSYNYKDTNQT